MFGSEVQTLAPWLSGLGLGSIQLPRAEALLLMVWVQLIERFPSAQRSESDCNWEFLELQSPGLLYLRKELGLETPQAHIPTYASF